MNKPYRIRIGSVGCDCARILITAPEAIKRMDADGIMDAVLQGRAMAVPSPGGGHMGVLPHHGLRAASSIYDMPAPGHGEDGPAGVTVETNGSDGIFPVYAEVDSDSHIRSVSVWFGFGPDAEEILLAICQRLAVDPESNYGKLEDLAYANRIDLPEFTDPDLAIKAIELACGQPMAELLAPAEGSK